MRFGLDASVTLAWCFRAESLAEATRVLELLDEHEALVPPNWPLEVANGLLEGERRGRLKVAETTRLFSILGRLPIEVAGLRPEEAPGLLSLAREASLTVYGAAYLGLSLKEGLPLATFDEGLRRAAERLGVALV